jgi:hypothetical protein
VAGKTLAGIGSFEFATPGMFDGDLIPRSDPGVMPALEDFVRDCLDSPAAQVINPSERDAFRELFRESLQSIGDLGPENRLVHCDYNPKNLILDSGPDEWGVAAVLDWEFAMSGTPLWDVANMLRHRSDYAPEFVDGFLSGFRSAGGSLSARWEQACLALDSINLIDFVRKGPDGPFFEFACDRIRSYVRSGSMHP